jgi:hypothetical protein
MHSNNKHSKKKKKKKKRGGKSFQKLKNLGPSQLTLENHYHMLSDRGSTSAGAPLRLLLGYAYPNNTSHH